MSRRFQTVALLVLAAAVLGTAPPAGATIIHLTGTIRDFNDTHPDFEGLIEVDPGIVLPNLGPGRKPVYAGQAGNPTTSGQASFDQWYRDVPGVNMTGSLTIPLDDTGNPPNVFTFSDDTFFPIDGQLFGNQGRDHNYHFTFEIHSRFTYQGGETFSFTGDDDLWVFINDLLVIDLGGVHGALSASLDLDTLGLTPGNDYNFDLFFAERHTTASSFRIDTSILLRSAPEPGSLLLLGMGLAGFAAFARKKRGIDLKPR